MIEFNENDYKSDSYIIVDIDLANIIGTHEALILCELLFERKHYLESGQVKDGWFFSTSENIKIRTGLTEFQQRKPIEKLISLGILEKKRMGSLGKRHFRIDNKRIIEIQNQNKAAKFSLEETTKLDSKKLPNKIERNYQSRLVETAAYIKINIIR